MGSWGSIHPLNFLPGSHQHPEIAELRKEKSQKETGSLPFRERGIEEEEKDKETERQAERGRDKDRESEQDTCRGEGDGEGAATDGARHRGLRTPQGAGDRGAD